MNASAVCPLFSTPRLAETKAFYENFLGFTAVADCPDYLGLQLGENGPSLGFLPPDPAEHPAASGEGIFYCFEVECADTLYAELLEKGAPVGAPPEDQPWGDRRFLMKDPNGITLYLARRARDVLSKVRTVLPVELVRRLETARLIAAGSHAPPAGIARTV